MRFRFRIGTDISIGAPGWDIDNVRIYNCDASGNQLPTANAGADQTVSPSSIVNLNASGSSDPEGGTLTYEWTQLSGAVVVFSNRFVVNPTITAPSTAGEVVVLQVTVTDSGGLTSTDTVSITVSDNSDNSGGGSDDGGGGGSALHFGALLGLLSFVAILRRRRDRS
ncbi:MAG: PKD domain-containing protein [Pseudomonadota bacterium]